MGVKKKYCKRGHLRSEENIDATYRCKKCNNAAQKAAYKTAPEKYREIGKQYARIPRAVLANAKRQAKRRGLAFDISDADFLSLRQLPCHYCGGSLPPVGTGLDRIDNKLGYVPGNVLPCCGPCNTHRQGTWTVQEAEIAIRAVLTFRKAQHSF